MRFLSLLSVVAACPIVPLMNEGGISPLSLSDSVSVWLNLGSIPLDLLIEQQEHLRTELDHMFHRYNLSVPSAIQNFTRDSFNHVSPTRIQLKFEIPDEYSRAAVVDAIHAGNGTLFTTMNVFPIQPYFETYIEETERSHPELGPTLPFTFEIQHASRSNFPQFNRLLARTTLLRIFDEAGVRLGWGDVVIDSVSDSKMDIRVAYSNSTVEKLKEVGNLPIGSSILIESLLNKTVMGQLLQQGLLMEEIVQCQMDYYQPQWKSKVAVRMSREILRFPPGHEQNFQRLNKTEGCGANFCVHLVFQTTLEDEFELQHLDSKQRIDSNLNPTQTPVISVGHSSVWTISKDNSGDFDMIFNLKRHQSSNLLMLRTLVMFNTPTQASTSVTAFNLDGLFSVDYSSSLLNSRELSLYINIQRSQGTEDGSGSGDYDDDYF